MSGFVIPEGDLRKQAEADGITHLSTGVAIVSHGKILAVRRSADDFLGGLFELPGGGIDPGETFAQAVAREVLEETGLTVTKILGMFLGFDYSTPKKPKVRQFNFVVTVQDGDVILSAEHDHARWVDQGNLDELNMSVNMKECFKAALVETNR